MNLYLAITDRDWFRFLRAQPEVDEVNFWQPGGTGTFRRLQPGEPFLFKLHAPDNFIVGGGFFAHFSRLPAGLAWEAFGEKNGARTFEEMRGRIGKYRRALLDPREDPTIGCVILAQPFFFDEIDWIPIPADFHLNIVQGKTYDALAEPGRSLWLRVQSVLRAAQPEVVAEAQQEMFGEPVLMRPRLGQGSCERGAAPSPGSGRCRCWRRRTSGRWGRAGAIASTTGSCCARTCTGCSTAATSRWGPTTGCG